MRIKQAFALLLLFFVLFSEVFLLLPYMTPAVLGVTEVVEWDIKARCLPHVSIESHDSFTVSFSHQSTSETVIVSAQLSTPGLPTAQAIDHRWGFPQHAWHSVLFSGPLVTAKFFCQDYAEEKKLHLSYYPKTDLKLSLSSRQELSDQELDTIDATGKKSFVAVRIKEDGSESFQAGQLTENPYYLTFSVPVHSRHDIDTILKYQFE